MTAKRKAPRLWGVKTYDGVVHAVLASLGGGGVNTYCRSQYFWLPDDAHDIKVKKFRSQFVESTNDNVSCIECLMNAP